MFCYYLERKSIDAVQAICDLFDEFCPRKDGQSYRDQMSFVQDRAGHDWRYAIDDTKAQKELGFTRSMANFEQGLRSTIEWYLSNDSWVQSVTKK